MRIGELAKRTGVSQETLRHLIEKGLIMARRPPGGHHRIASAEVPKIIKTLTEYGLMEPQAEQGRGGLDAKK